MSGLGSIYQNHVLDAVFGAGFTKPATIYIALLSTSITANDGTSGVEITGNGYARVAVTNNATNFGPAAFGRIHNNLTATFPTVTGSAWLPTAGFALYDNITLALVGNLIAWGVITAPKTYSPGQAASFGPGQLVITNV